MSAGDWDAGHMEAPCRPPVGVWAGGRPWPGIGAAWAAAEAELQEGITWTVWELFEHATGGQLGYFERVDGELVLFGPEPATEGGEVIA